VCERHKKVSQGSKYMEDDKWLGHHGMMRSDENVEKVRALVRKDVFTVIQQSK
jgi:hypothetical protein